MDFFLIFKKTFLLSQMGLLWSEDFLERGLFGVFSYGSWIDKKILPPPPPRQKSSGRRQRSQEAAGPITLRPQGVTVSFQRYKMPGT